MRIKFVQNIIDRFRHKLPGLKSLANKKFGYDAKNPENIKTLILGSSHLASGYRAQEGEYNFAYASQDLYYSYLLYKKYNTEHVKNVVVSFSVFTPGHIIIKTNTANFCIFYKLLHGFNYQYEEDAEERKFAKLEKYYAKELARYKKKSQINYSEYHGSMLKYPKDRFREDIAKETALGQYKNNLRENNQMDFCAKLIEETSKNSQNIIFVITPMTDLYKKHLPKSEELFYKLYELCQGQKHVKILNYYDSDEFDYSDFCDEHHLKLKGAKKITAKIRRYLK